MADHVFISHSSEDQSIALRWCEALERAGLPCWIAPRDIRPGAEWAAQIIEGIEGARSVLLLLGAAANRSSQVLREIERATHKSVPVVTVWLEKVQLAKSLEYFLSSLHWIGLDGSGFDEQVLQVMRALDGLAPRIEAPRLRCAENNPARLTSGASRDVRPGTRATRRADRACTRPACGSACKRPVTVDRVARRGNRRRRGTRRLRRCRTKARRRELVGIVALISPGCRLR